MSLVEQTPDRLRLACDCQPGGVDLVLVRRREPWSTEVWLSRWHRQGRTGLTSTCPCCGRAWALAGTLSGTGPLVLVQVPRLEPGTELPAEVLLALAVHELGAVR